MAGNAPAVRLLAGVDQRLVLQAWTSSTRPPVTRTAVLRVLTDLASGAVSQEAAGTWAKFIFSGHLAGAPYPLMPLDIEYDEIDDEVAESIMKLELIGDPVEGTVDGERLATLISKVRRGTA